MNLLDAAAIKRVQSLGRRVVDPNDPPDLAEAQRVLLAAGFRVTGPSDPPDVGWAMSMLADAGYRVFPPLSAPAVDSLWKPTRGRTFARKVLAVENGHVTYQLPDEPLSAPHRPALKSWHEWRTRTRAKQVVP